MKREFHQLPQKPHAKEQISALSKSSLIMTKMPNMEVVKPYLHYFCLGQKDTADWSSGAVGL